MSIQLHIQGNGGHFRGWWLDNSAGKPWSDIAAYNFNAMTGSVFDWRSAATGSYALSENFTVNAGQELAIAATLASAHRQPYWDFGFALLVQGNTLINVLFCLRPDGNSMFGDMGPPVLLAPPSPGVTLQAVAYDGSSNVLEATGIDVGGVNYGQHIDLGNGNLATYLSSRCSPAAGEYQILFGIFATDIVPFTPPRPAGLIAEFISVV
jgi:hypothetical protein